MTTPNSGSIIELTEAQLIAMMMQGGTSYRYPFFLLGRRLVGQAPQCSTLRHPFELDILGIAESFHGSASGSGRVRGRQGQAGAY
jgi:hypothetical protein